MGDLKKNKKKQTKTNLTSLMEDRVTHSEQGTIMLLQLYFCLLLNMNPPARGIQQSLEV